MVQLLFTTMEIRSHANPNLYRASQRPIGWGLQCKIQTVWPPSTRASQFSVQCTGLAAEFRPGWMRDIIGPSCYRWASRNGLSGCGESEWYEMEWQFETLLWGCCLLPDGSQWLLEDRREEECTPPRFQQRGVLQASATMTGNRSLGQWEFFSRPTFHFHFQYQTEWLSTMYQQYWFFLPDKCQLMNVRISPIRHLCSIWP